MKKLHQSIIVVALAVSFFAVAMPNSECSKIYYSDSSKTTVVGEKLTAMCHSGTVDIQIWGETSDHFEVATETC